MKLIAVKCPNCGANLECEEGMQKIFCKYCGTPVILDDESVNINVTNRIIDEAEVERVKLKRTQYEHEHERQIEEEKDFKTREEEWRRLLLPYLGAVAVTLFLGMLFTDSKIIWLKNLVTALFGAVLIVGGIGMYIMKPKKSGANNKIPTYNVHVKVTGAGGYRYSSDRSKIVAFALCLFFGFFGAHYFYVRRTGMGIVYLFTMGMFCFGWFYDLFRIAVGSFEDSEGRKLR